MRTCPLRITPKFRREFRDGVGRVGRGGRRDSERAPLTLISVEKNASKVRLWGVQKVDRVLDRPRPRERPTFKNSRETKRGASRQFTRARRRRWRRRAVGPRPRAWRARRQLEPTARQSVVFRSSYVSFMIWTMDQSSGKARRDATRKELDRSSSTSRSCLPTRLHVPK